MIHVFYGCGSFGSTIEYVLRNYTGYSTAIDSQILPDGSMHSYQKECHVTQLADLDKLVSASNQTVTTPIYPFQDLKLPDIILRFSSLPSWKIDKKILIYQPDLGAVELNLLFQYHKVCNGSVLKTGLGIIVGDNRHNITAWNSNYTHWNQMQVWELREWLSLFYPGYAQEIIAAQQQVDHTWLTISNIEFLTHTESSIKRIIDFCELELQQPIQNFVHSWQRSQRYVQQEFDLLGQIVNSAINNTELVWEPTNIVAESIVQQRLRQKGYEIQCDGLNSFPTSATKLHNLLETSRH